MRKKAVSRRDFLKFSVAGLGAGLGGCAHLGANEKIPPAEGQKQKEEKKEKITYRTLGKTGIKLPVVTMGVQNSNNPNLVRAALDGGMVHLDTAHYYQRGTNEAMIGEVVKGRPRDSFVIATKESLPKNRITGLYRGGATEKAFLGQLDISLKRLGLEYVDILYQHNVWKREAVLFEPVLKALEKAKKEGKTRFVGVSTHRNEPEVIQAAVDSQVYDVVETAYNFRQKHYVEVRKAIATAAKAGLGVVAMKTIGGWSPEWQEHFGGLGSPGPYLAGQGADVRAAMKWVLQDPNVHTIIAGITTFDQLEVDLKLQGDFSLSKSEKENLQSAALQSSLYCQGCGTCLNACVKQLPIPDLMRAYMYVYGYRNLVEAQDLLASLDIPANPCEDCGPCPVQCLNRWNVSERLQNIVRLRDVPPEFIA
jgi:predicted aldo/keto reductase-like oxidoreductase